jgi:hypothetical protein
MATYAAIFPPTIQPTGQPTKWVGGTKSYLLWELVWSKISGEQQKKFWEAARLEDEKKTWFSDKSKKRETLALRGLEELFFQLSVFGSGGK